MENPDERVTDENKILLLPPYQTIKLEYGRAVALVLCAISNPPLAAILAPYQSAGEEDQLYSYGIQIGRASFTFGPTCVRIL